MRLEPWSLEPHFSVVNLNLDFGDGVGKALNQVSKIKSSVNQQEKQTAKEHRPFWGMGRFLSVSLTKLLC